MQFLIKLLLVTFSCINLNNMFYLDVRQKILSSGAASTTLKLSSPNRLRRSKPNQVCPPSDHSIKCKLFRSRLRYVHIRKRRKVEPVLSNFIRGKRETTEDVKDDAKDSDSASNLKPSKSNVMQKDSRMYLAITSNLTEEVKAKRQKITRKYKTYWRFYNGRYQKLPVCNTTAVPGQEITFQPWNSTIPPIPGKPIIKPIPLTFQQRSQLLEAHNEERRKVFPPAKNMRMMSWDAELVWVAEFHTKNCKFSERDAFREVKDGLPIKDIVRHSGIDAEIGFNWFAWENTRALPSDFISEVIEAWVSEKKYYDFDTRKCQSVCRHFLQVVWAETYKLGCAVSCCGAYYINGVKWHTTTAIICAYAPRGNVLEFTASAATSFAYPTPPRTKYPYKYGPTCEDCGGYYESAPSVGQDVLDLPDLNASEIEIFIPDMVITTTQRNVESTDRNGNHLDYCTARLCANTERDRDIPFIPPDVSTTTTFSWTTSLTPRVKQYGELECLNPDLFNVFSEDGKATEKLSSFRLMFLTLSVSQICKNFL